MRENYLFGVVVPLVMGEEVDWKLKEVEKRSELKCRASAVGAVRISKNWLS